MNGNNLDRLLLELRTLDADLSVRRAEHGIRRARLEEGHRQEVLPLEARRVDLLQEIRTIAAETSEDAHLTHGSVVRRVHPVEVVFDHGEEHATKLLLSIGRYDLLRTTYQPRKELLRGVAAEVLRELGVRLVRKASLVVRITNGGELVWPVEVAP